MFTVSLREFKNLFTSIRSIIIIIILFGVSIGSAKLIQLFEPSLSSLGLGEDIYTMGFMLLLILVAPLFITTLSHNTVNKEIDSRTVRFIATKTPRYNIILGKFIGTFLFWLVCITVSLLLITLFSKSFSISILIESLIFVTYFIGLTQLLSTIITKPSLTLFLGMMISIALPILGLWSTVTEHFYIKIFGYISPYFYYLQLENNNGMLYFVLLFPVLFILLSLLIFRKKDL